MNTYVYVLNYHNSDTHPPKGISVESAIKTILRQNIYPHWTWNSETITVGVFFIVDAYGDIPNFICLVLASIKCIISQSLMRCYTEPLKLESGIYIIISKNIRYLLWNRGARRFFHDTYLTIEVQGIRCTNHLHDSCPLTDVYPHFTAPGCRYYFKINSSWPIVTSSTHGPAASYCDVTMIHCSRVSMDAWCWGRRELKGLRAHGANDGLAAVDGKLKLSKR